MPPSDALPAFPLPAPKPSAKTEIALRSVAQNARNLGAVEQSLARKLDQAGYSRRSYYSVPGGFALATQAERFNRDGRSARGYRRWRLDPTGLIEMPEPFSFGGLLAALRHADPGRYRVIVFVVTTVNQTSGAGAITVDAARAMVEGGGDRLPPGIAALPVTSEQHLTALIYTFSRVSVNASMRFDDPSGLDALSHLRAAGLIGGTR